ncbi:VPS25 family protein [Abortiporus biennis]
MALSPHTTQSGFTLPSIHSFPPFFTKQVNLATQATVTEHWTKLILSYARHKRLFTIRVEDAQKAGNDWDEILRNERINRSLPPSHLSYILNDMVSKNLAMYDPPKQTGSVLLYWRSPEEWAETLYDWVSSSGQLNTIMTFLDITDPPVQTPLSGLPLTILRRAIGVLQKTNRAQMIAITEGEGVRFFGGR